MRIDWGMLLTIFLAVVLAEMFCRSLFAGGSIGGSKGSVGAATHNPAEAAQVIVTYANPIDEFIAKRYPNAR